MQDRGGRAACVLDERHGTFVALLDERLAVGGDVTAGLRQPVGDLDRGIAECLSDRIPDRRSSCECEEDVSDARSCQPAAQDAREKRNRHERERDEEDVVERLRRILREGADDELDPENEHHERAGAEHGPSRGEALLEDRT